MFPNSGLLLLKKAKDAPEAATIEIILPDGREVTYQVPLVKMSDYDIDVIFSKRLYMLLPFYIFNYENELEDINDSEEKIEKMFSVYDEIYGRLDNELEQGNLSEISFHAIIRLIHKVAYKLTMNCENVQKKVGDIMGGKVLDLPEFVAYDQAKAEGKAEGRAEGKAEERVENIKIFVRDKIEDEIPTEKIIDKLKKNYNLSADEAKRYIDQCVAEIKK